MQHIHRAATIRRLGQPTVTSVKDEEHCACGYSRQVTTGDDGSQKITAWRKYRPPSSTSHILRWLGYILGWLIIAAFVFVMGGQILGGLLIVAAIIVGLILLYLLLMAILYPCYRLLKWLFTP